jgi:hypothetical protein
MDPTLIETIDHITESFVGVHDQIMQTWLTRVLFSWHWWLDVALAVLPWVLWLIVRRRDQQRRLLFAGLATALLATYLDTIGMSRGWWTYYTWVLPLMPEYLPWDLSVMPVTAMLFYQYKQNWNPWLKAAIFGVFGAFISEPLFEWIGIYKTITWQYWYSLPIYIAVFMLGYAIFMRRSLKSAPIPKAMPRSNKEETKRC